MSRGRYARGRYIRADDPAPTPDLPDPGVVELRADQTVWRADVTPGIDVRGVGWALLLLVAIVALMAGIVAIFTHECGLW